MFISLVGTEFVSGNFTKRSKNKCQTYSIRESLAKMKKKLPSLIPCAKFNTSKAKLPSIPTRGRLV